MNDLKGGEENSSFNLRLLALINAISFSRIPLSAALIATCLDPNKAIQHWSFVLYLAALLSDIIDGFLARRYKLQTTFGYVADGLGDRAFYLAQILIVCTVFTFLTICNYQIKIP